MFLNKELSDQSARSLLKLSLFVFLAVGLPLEASATGPGLRRGGFLLHPSAQVQGVYDSNVYYEDASENDGPNAGTMFLLGAGLNASNRNTNNIALRFKGDFNFRLQTSLDSEISEASERNGIESTSLRLDVGLMPKSPLSVNLDGSLKYSERAASEGFAGYEKLDLEGGGNLLFRPGRNPASRALELSLGYHLNAVGLDFGEYKDSVSTADGRSRANKLSHKFDFSTRWKFFPKTAAFLDVSLFMIDYNQPSIVIGDNTTESTNRDSTPFKATLGVEGLVTQRISVDIGAGFMNTFNSEGESFQGFIAHVVGNYVFEPTFNLRLGYKRGASDTSFSNFYTVHNAFADAELFFLDKLSVGAKLAWYLYVYSASGSPNEAAGQVAVEREDPIIKAEGRLSYNLKAWAQASAVWSLENNMSDWVDEGQVDNPAKYSRQLLMFKLSAQY